MISSNNLQLNQAKYKEEKQSFGHQKTPATSARPPHDQQALKCPRCDSSNTKFCYYNNYSQAQPRHFCKTCRRYWTKGGALRNVPIGGGCRRNKKMKSSSSILPPTGDSKNSSGSSEMGTGLKFFHGISPAMNFNPGGLSFSWLNPFSCSFYDQFSPFMDVSSTSTAAGITVTNPCLNLDSSVRSLLGFSNPFSPVGYAGAIQDTGSAGSSGGGGGGGSFSQAQKPQPIFFQNLETSKPEVNSVFDNSRKENHTATGWFLGNSHEQINPTSSTTSSNGNGSAAFGGYWNIGVQAWGNFNRYINGLP